MPWISSSTTWRALIRTRHPLTPCAIPTTKRPRIIPNKIRRRRHQQTPSSRCMDILPTIPIKCLLWATRSIMGHRNMKTNLRMTKTMWRTTCPIHMVHITLTTTDTLIHTATLPIILGETPIHRNQRHPNHSLRTLCHTRLALLRWMLLNLRSSLSRRISQ